MLQKVCFKILFVTKYLFTENNFLSCLIKGKVTVFCTVSFEVICLELTQYKNLPKERGKSINYAIN